jgi:hypothetical protein
MIVGTRVEQRLLRATLNHEVGVLACVTCNNRQLLERLMELWLSGCYCTAGARVFKMFNLGGAGVWCAARDWSLLPDGYTCLGCKRDRQHKP